MFALRKIAYFLSIIHWCNASNIERIDIHIDKLRLTNILYGSTELAHLRCNECLSNNTSEFIEGSLVLNGFGSRFISMPKKNYRFNYNNESIVLVNAIEPGRISTSLFNTLTEAAGGNAIYQQFIELYINNVYNGLYYTKHMSFAVNYTEVFKIETDAVPDNSYLLSDLDINTNMDHSYNIFSYISSLFAVDDMTMHNYAILRNGHENDEHNATFGITAWDTDLALGAPTKSPILYNNYLNFIGSIFMINRLADQSQSSIKIDTFHNIKSKYNLFNPINAPSNITTYNNEFVDILTNGVLTIENITTKINNYENYLSDAFKRDEAKWGDYYCLNDNLFSIDYLKTVLFNNHAAILNTLTNNTSVYIPTPYQYCNYMDTPNPIMLSISILSGITNSYYRNWKGLTTTTLLLLAFLIFNRVDLANPAPILDSHYLVRNDMVTLLTCFILLIIFSPTNPRKMQTKNFMLFSYSCISIIISTIGIIETVQLGELSKTHQTISSTGKILIDTSIFDVRRGEVLFISFIYWKLICQLVFVQITFRIPDICDYTPPKCRHTLPSIAPSNIGNFTNEHAQNKKKIIARFIKFNIFAFTSALVILFAIWPPQLNTIEITIQIVSAFISTLVLFNLRGIYVILKWAMLKNYNIKPDTFNVIMSTRSNHIWNLNNILLDEQIRMNNDIIDNNIEYTINELDTRPIARRLRTADAFPKKLSHIIDGLVVFILSVQQLGENNETLIDVISLSGAIILFQLFVYGISYNNNGRIGFIVYGSKSRIMDGYLGRENEIFGWICDKYMLPLSFLLEQLLGQHLDENIMCPVSYMIFMPIIVGDSFGEIIGSTWGKQKIQVWGMGETNKKSYEGTIAVFVSSFVCLISAAAYYKMNPIAYLLAFTCSVVSTFVELYAPRSTDNVFMLLANLGCCLLFASQFNLSM